MLKRIVLLCLLVQGACFAGSGIIYTVQLSSYSLNHIDKAIDGAQLLENRGYGDIRVEEIGGMLTVRAGVFSDLADAQDMADDLRRYFPDCFARSAYYIESRVIYPPRKSDGSISGLSEKLQGSSSVEPGQESEIIVLKDSKDEVENQDTADIEAESLPDEIATEEISLATDTPFGGREDSAGVEQEEREALMDTGEQSSQAAADRAKATGQAPYKDKTSEVAEPLKNRIEAGVSLQDLGMPDGGDSWQSLDLAYYRTVSDDFTYFLRLSSIFRDENGGVFALGAYRDWTDGLYTYTSVAMGTDSPYTSRFRVDNNFNFKLGPDRNIVLMLGTSYTDYFDVHTNAVLSTGVTVYLEELVLGYRLALNRSDPGSLYSSSHSLNINSGRANWRWLNLSISYGDQAYMGTYLTTPEEINRSSYEVSVGLRQWLADNWGVFGSIRYLQFIGDYNKYGITTGFFNEF